MIEPEIRRSIDLDLPGYRRPARAWWAYPDCPDCTKRREHARIVAELAKDSGLSEDDRRMRFESWEDDVNPGSGPDDPGAQVAKAYVTKLCHEFAMWRSRRRGLLLMGPPGTGKTHLAIAAAWYLIEREIPCRIVHVPSLLDRLTHRGGPLPGDIIAEVLRGISYLVLDRISVEPYERKAMTMLLEAVRGEIVLVGTTSYTPEQLGPALGETAVSILNRLCLPVLVTGQDYRKHEAEKLARIDMGEAEG